MKRVVFVSLAAFLAVSLSAQTTDTKKDSEVELNQYGQQVNSTPGQVKIQDGIMVLDAKKIDYKMWFDIRVQGDAAVFFGGPDFTSSQLDGKDNPNHIGNGMSIRRARFAVKAQLDRNWYGEIDTDWADGICELKDAILAYNGVPGLEIKAGNFKESFSIQRNTTSRYLMFMERPMVTSLAPSRHLGLNLTYSNKWIWFAGGVFGPELKGAEEATAMKDNNKDLGRNAGLSYTGKVVFRPLYKCSESALHLGGAISSCAPSFLCPSVHKPHYSPCCRNREARWSWCGSMGMNFHSRQHYPTGCGWSCGKQPEGRACRRQVLLHKRQTRDRTMKA